MDAGVGGVKKARAATGKKLPTVVSVLNLKGGVGKTTVTALLARYASGAGGWRMSGQRNLNVLAVDLDPQANLSQALMGKRSYKEFMGAGGAAEPSIVELFKGFAGASSKQPSPSETGTSVVKKISPPGATGNLELVPSRFDFSYRLIDSVRTDETVLANFIKNKMKHKDLILIDCAPTESVLTQAAYHASRYVLIPVRTEYFATIGFRLMKESLEQFKKRNRGNKIDIGGVLINKSDTSGAAKGPHYEGALREIREYARDYGWAVFENRMHHSRGYPKWAENPNAPYLGNAEHEWPKVAREILSAVGL